MSAFAHSEIIRRTDPLALIAFGVALVATATLGAAWAFQIWGGYIPCPLCLEQRIPYYVGVPLVVLAGVAATSPGRRMLARAGLGAVGAVFLWGGYLALYHAGAEWGWWAGPAGCAIDLGAVTDASGLLARLRDFTPVRCDEAPWRFLGLSFAGWNFAISAGLAVSCFAGALRLRWIEGRWYRQSW